ncbi:hypothetical protein BDV95DRAFT_221506 [Massariosphaeria phaeospora]|uniref:Zn(2)-C6 fungal-type domain-containing protein n=1 Tax=Massariosphaeria phaeospora TaxID=100035 RepID=A0A7C8IG12_9PLEO|nr:hypothetical protein BDV95DRAFT_221506 [Massariosphaeria phaeospora]
MPNVGKPSKGCQNCRDRKVKCDQKRPSCSQCVRIKKECFGYRDPLSMMFKNESAVVARKAKQRYQELKKQASPEQSSENDSLSLRSASKTATHSTLSTPGPSFTAVSNELIDPLLFSWADETTPWTRPMTPSIEDQAVSFFVSNYVVTPALVPRGQFDFLPELLNQPGIEKVLKSSVTAASLASLAQSTKSAHIMKQAQAEYVTALSMTNKALKSTNTAKKTSTLIAVIMLGMYENFVFQGKESITSWANHVQGASALISLRGREQFRDKLGLRIFQQFYGTILLVSLQNRSAIPPRVVELWEEITRLGDYNVQGKQWTVVMVRFMQQAINLTHDKTSDPAVMVSQAMKLDRELDDIKAQVPNIWTYETVYLDHPSQHVYGDFYHVYLDPWIVQMWNNLRTVRIMLHQVLRLQLLRGCEQFPPMFKMDQVESQITHSEHIVRSAMADMAASAPQITGQVPFPTPPVEQLNRQSSCAEYFDPDDVLFKPHVPGTFLNPSRPTGMHHLIWPLFVIGENDLCTSDFRQWAIDQLHFVALSIGTRQAVVLAEQLQERQALGFMSPEGEGFSQALRIFMPPLI